MKSNFFKTNTIGMPLYGCLETCKYVCSICYSAGSSGGVSFFVFCHAVIHQLKDQLTYYLFKKY